MTIDFPTFRRYVTVVMGLVIFELLSWFAYRSSSVEQTVSAFVIIGLVIVSWRRPRWLVYASIAELMVGGKGYLLFLTVGDTRISLRLFMFFVLFASSVSRIIRHWQDERRTVLNRPFTILIGWLTLGVLIGFARGHGPSAVFLDANGFLYLGLLPVWWIELRGAPRWRSNVLAILLASATVIGLKSWLMVLLFGQAPAFIDQVYAWIRNTGIGEVTQINNNIYRVFFQSQIYSVISLVVILALWVTQRAPRWFTVPLFFAALGTYVSLSRSLWLGTAGALLVFSVWLARRFPWRSLTRLWIILPAAAFAWAMMVWAISWPSFDFRGRPDVLSSRIRTEGSADAATARRNQIRPLFRGIAIHPVIGSGFGQTVTYFSTDPTVRGDRTTYAFELGYLDLWLKIGLIGLALYGWWIFALWKRSLSSPWGMMYILGGCVLITVHLTSPYLNHPLGLGWLMLTALNAHE